METKICTACKEELPIDSFRFRKYKNGVGHTSYCIPCERKKNKEYYESKKEFLKEEARRYYAENKEACLNRVHKYNKLNGDYRRKRDREYYRNHYAVRLVGAARHRAAKKGLEFELKPEDLQIPAECPLLKIQLEIGNKTVSDNSPSLDRLDPNKGYTLDNVWVISHKANTMKSNASLEELKLLVTNLENKIKEL